jgi:hypothetical protein
MTLSKNHPASTFLSIGFGIWLVATLTVRLAGQWLFVPGNVGLAVLMNIAVVPVMILLMQAIYQGFGVESTRRPLVAVWVALPGLFLDGLLNLFVPAVLPNMLPEARHLFAGWLFLAYGAAFLSALRR